MPRASKKVVIEEPLVEHKEQVIKKKPLRREPAKPKIVVPEPEPEVESDVSAESEQEEEVEQPKQPVKSKVKKEKKPLSLWMQTLQANGYMCKGGAFKPTPKKGTPEYATVRAAFDAAKAAEAK